MNAGQGGDRLTIQSDSYILHVLLGPACIGMGLFFFRECWPQYAVTRQVGPLFAALVGLVFVVAGAAILIFRPSIFAFDRATGELTVLRRTIVSQKKERYPLSDIGAVVLETDKRDREYGLSYSVQLL